MDPALTQAVAVFATALLIGVACAFLPFRAYLRAAGATAPRRMAALMAVAVFSVAGVAAYAAVGRPALADAPYKERYAGWEAQVQANPMETDPNALLEVLAERARRNPTDPRPLRFAGDVFLMLGEGEQAQQMYQRALRVAPEDPDTMLGIAQALMSSPNGPPPVVVAGLLANALPRLRPDDPRRPQVEAALKEMAGKAMAASPRAPAADGSP